MEMSKKILLIDGHGIAFRAFYAVPGLTAPDGTPTNVLVGFFNMLSKVCHDLKPDEIYTAFDMAGPTFRHRIFPDYKANRKPAPDEFKQQLPILQKMLPLLGIRIMQRSTVEADDLIGSAAKLFAESGNDVLVLTSDKDIMQILAPHITLIRPGRGVSSFDKYTAESFTEKNGFAPDKVVDYLALMGDSVDNIPGVPGVGKKTAARLMTDYASIEDIMNHLNDLKPGVRKRMTEHGQTAIDTRKLTKLKSDEDLSEFINAPSVTDLDAFGEMCSDLGMKKVATSFGAPVKKSTKKDDTKTLSLDFSDSGEEKDTESGDDFLNAVPASPTGEISLETILNAPRLGIDMEENGTGIIIAAPDGSWHKTDSATLISHAGEILKHRIVCFDAKRFCALFPKPEIAEISDIRTAWYLIHPDLPPFNAEEYLPGGHSPERALLMLAMHKKMMERISELGLETVMNDIDLPLVPVLINMERRGIRLDRDKMLLLDQELSGQIEKLSNHIYESAGGEINLNSPKQVGELLFEKLGLPVIKKTKTGYSTNVTVLEKLKELVGGVCDIPAGLLEYRELAKMSSGFVQPLLNAADGNGIIHSTFEALTTGTGRLSSRDPNMQNLPNYSDWGDKIRSCLIPSAPGNCFVSADYSQIELRVLAHLSRDPQLIRIFKSDRDIHTETAALVFNLPPEAVTKELRRNAKTVSFGLIYGMSVFGLASRLGTDRKSAQKVMDAYFAALPGVRKYLENSMNRSLSEGYTSTLYGRRRPMDEITTGTGRALDHQKRVAVNAPIQGTAADITKIAMNRVREEFAGEDIHMVLQVHDSIVVECPISSAEETARRLDKAMEHAVSLDVPLKTETATGPSLAEV